MTIMFKACGMQAEPLMAVRGDTPVEAPLKKSGGLVTRQGFKRAFPFQAKIDLGAYPAPEIPWLGDFNMEIRKSGFCLKRMIGVQAVQGCANVIEAGLDPGYERASNQPE